MTKAKSEGPRHRPLLALTGLSSSTFVVSSGQTAAAASCVGRKAVAVPLCHVISFLIRNNEKRLRATSKKLDSISII